MSPTTPVTLAMLWELIRAAEVHRDAPVPCGEVHAPTLMRLLQMLIAGELEFDARGNLQQVKR